MDVVTQGLIDQIKESAAAEQTLVIRGQGSKQFYGNAESGKHLSTAELSGIVEYDPSELVITAKAGTPLSELQDALAECNQMLAFEPPLIKGQGSVGGMIASGMAGARRPWAGGVRDYVLGLHVINGKGEYCKFGGQVMKNVAGYDVSRLMVGAMGCLGLMTQASIKVLPKPQVIRSAALELPLAAFVQTVSSWQHKMTPVSGVAHDGRKGYLRLEGFGQNVDAFAKANNLLLSDDLSFWESLQRQSLPLFESDQALWRLSLPQWSCVSDLEAEFIMDWAGGQYWVQGSSRDDLAKQVSKFGGHICAYRNIEEQAFAPLSAGAMLLHKRLKHAYDPAGIFNPGRLYTGL